MMTMKRIKDVMPTLRNHHGFFRNFPTYGTLTPTTLAVMYSAHSGEKVISPLVDWYIDENNETLTTVQENELGTYLLSVYGTKWQKIADAIDAQYDILKDFETREVTDGETSENGTDTNAKGATTTTQNYGATSSSTQYGQQTETFKKGTVTEQNSLGAGQTTTQYGAKSTTNSIGAKTTNNTHSVNGFNGGLVTDSTDQNTENARNDQISEATHTDTVSEQAKTDTKTTTTGDDTTTNAQHTDTTTEQARTDSTTTNAVTDTLTKENATTQDIIVTKEGRMSPAMELIRKEIELRKINLKNIIFKDIDSELTLKIYI